MFLRGCLVAIFCLLLSPSDVLPEQHTHAWSQRFGDAEYQSGYSVAVDASGNVIITGVFEGTVDFGGGPLTSAGGWDIYVAKFDSNGHHLWSQRFGDSDPEEAASIAVDASGNVFVTGSFAGVVDFGGGPLTSAGLGDIFVARFDASGSHLWSKSFGDTDSQASYSIAVDSQPRASGRTFRVREKRPPEGAHGTPMVPQEGRCQQHCIG